jgi:hypothetical protein
MYMGIKIIIRLNNNVKKLKHELNKFKTFNI